MNCKQYHNLIPFRGKSTFLSWPSNICFALKTWHNLPLLIHVSSNFKSLILFLIHASRVNAQYCRWLLKVAGKTAGWECIRTRAKENIRLFKSVSNWRMKKLTHSQYSVDQPCGLKRLKERGHCGDHHLCGAIILHGCVTSAEFISGKKFNARIDLIR